MGDFARQRIGVEFDEGESIWILLHLNDQKDVVRFPSYQLFLFEIR